jgi:CHAD domain-containing protein
LAYRIGSGEPVDEALRRICLEQLDKAAKDLSGDEFDVHESVHQARKRFKRIRAALRLVRPALGDSYAAENAWFRDEARDLSKLRDASALIETIDRLAETFADQADAAFLDRVREALVERRERLAEQEADIEHQVAELAGALGGARERLAGWTLDAQGFDAVGPGFQKTYARGRRAVSTAYADPTPEHFHELRKRAKYHRYHLQVLVPVWPIVLKPFLRAAHDLTDLLGENQDLNVMRQVLLGEPDLLDRGRDAQVLLGLVDRRQSELQSRAAPLAQRLFAERPAAATARLGAYWHAWATGTTEEPAREDAGTDD